MQTYLCKDSNNKGVTKTSKEPFNFTVAVVLLVFSNMGPSTVSEIKNKSFFYTFQ